MEHTFAIIPITDSDSQVDPTYIPFRRIHLIFQVDDGVWSRFHNPNAILFRKAEWNNSKIKLAFWPFWIRLTPFQCLYVWRTCSAENTYAHNTIHAGVWVWDTRMIGGDPFQSWQQNDDGNAASKTKTLKFGIEKMRWRFHPSPIQLPFHKNPIQMEFVWYTFKSIFGNHRWVELGWLTGERLKIALFSTYQSDRLVLRIGMTWFHWARGLCQSDSWNAKRTQTHWLLLLAYALVMDYRFSFSFSKSFFPSSSLYWQKAHNLSNEIVNKKNKHI